MTKKTFELVAAVLKDQRDTMPVPAFTALTKAFADKFTAENPNFKTALFFKVAGWTEVK